MLESGLEAMAKRFVALASMPMLSKLELEEARNLMRDLRRAGMSNQEIAGLSGGRWTESSVKGYTKHLRPTEAAVWQDAVGVLRDLIGNDVSIEDVKGSQELVANLNRRRVSVDTVADFLQMAEGASVDIAWLIREFKELNDGGLTARDITEAVTLKKELEGEEISLRNLSMLAKLARTYGVGDDVLGALSAYGSLTEIENQRKTVDQELRQAIERKSTAMKELAEVKQRLAQERLSLESFQRVRNLGFDEKVLYQLADTAEKHGGLKPFLKAVAAHDEHSCLMRDIRQAKAQRASLQTAIEKLDAKYSHQRSGVEMCRKLLTEYGLGLDAVATILAMARKHGEPSVILKCIEGYGDLQTMMRSERELDGRIEEKESLLAKLEGRYDEAMNVLDKLNGRCITAGTEVARLESRLMSSRELKLVITLMNQPSMATFSEYAPTALAMAAGLRQFAEGHQKNLPNLHTIRSGLQALVVDLGG